MVFFSAALLISLLLCKSTLASSELSPRQASGVIAGQGYFSPASHGGSMLTDVDGTYPAGLHEVLNIIVSNLSDPRVLGEAREAWMAALGYSSDCLGQWPENQHRANLGDGLGATNQTDIKRWNYGDYNFGSCQQTILGGNHFRYWIQSGSEARSGALFLASSVEDDLANGHRISEPNGYDMGRDQIVGNATQPHSAFGYTFNATATTVTGLLPTGTGSTRNNTGINHGIPVDGNVTVLIVSILASNQALLASSGILSSSIPIALCTIIGLTSAVVLGSTAYLVL